MNNWKEEIELVNNLGVLYPKITWVDYNKKWDNYTKACWVCALCVRHLDQRMPQLEEFIKKNNYWAWEKYKEYFDIK